MNAKQAVEKCRELVRGRYAGRDMGSSVWLEIGKIDRILRDYGNTLPQEEVSQAELRGTDIAWDMIVATLNEVYGHNRWLDMENSGAKSAAAAIKQLARLAEASNEEHF